MFNWCGLGTSNRFYTLLYNKFGKKKYEGTLLQVDSVVQTPNFWRTPEGSYEKLLHQYTHCNSAASRLRAVAYPHEVLLLDNATAEVVKRCLNRDSFKFDVRRGLLKFNPAQVLDDCIDWNQYHNLCKCRPLPKSTLTIAFILGSRDAQHNLFGVPAHIS
jgi:hypothetical protein